MSELMKRELSEIGVTMENFDKALEYLKSKRDDSDGNEFNDFEAKAAFFFGEPTMLIFVKKNEFDGKKVTMTVNGKDMRVSPLAALINSAIHPTRAAIPYNDLTMALYMMFDKKCRPFKSDAPDIPTRLRLFKNFAGKEVFEKAMTEYQSAFYSTMNLVSIEQIALEYETNGLGFDRYREAAQFIFEGIGGEEQTVIGTQYRNEAAYPVLLPYHHAHKDPQGNAGQKSPRLLQGNLNNIVFALLNDLLEEQKSCPYGRIEHYAGKKIEAVRTLFGIAEFERKGKYYENIVEIFKIHFGEEEIDKAQDTIIEALNHVKAQSEAAKE